MAWFTSVIPDGCVEVPGNADWAVTDAAGHNVGFRINDVTGGTSVKVTTSGGDTVTFDNVVVGEDIPISINKLFNTGTTVTSIHVFYVK